MDSSAALIQAASGLERLMVGAPKTGIIRDSTVAQISAFLYYEASVIAKLTSNKQFQQLFRKTIFDGLQKDFGLYIDAQARTKPKALGHVYEWNKVGDQSGRLFKLKMISKDKLSFKFDYEFKLSRSATPNKFKKNYVFSKKASVMEAGMPIIISPRSSERLVFEMNGETVFMPKGASVTVKRPGGIYAKNAFGLKYSTFFSGELVKSSMMASGFHNLFNAKISKALSVPVDIKKVKFSFSPNQIRNQADVALAAAFGGGTL